MQTNVKFIFGKECSAHHFQRFFSLASAGKLDRADTLVKLLACDGDSTDAATEVRALAGAYVERQNYNIGRSILCSPKRSPILYSYPLKDV